MPRCTDPRDLSELDTVTFFIVTELMAAEGERRMPDHEGKDGIPLFEFSHAKVA